MANYCCITRTNYFHVKDPDAFCEFMKRVIAEDSVDVWEEKDSDGSPVFGFGCYGSIFGVNMQPNNDDDCECDWEEFVHGLSDHVADDDAVIIMESGNEKMRYIVGSASVVTSTDYEYMDIASLAVKKASQMLKNPDWRTQIDY